MSGDGVGLSPRDYASLLADLAGRSEIVEDVYLLGGEIERFEHRWAEVLGKERAVFMPSGTLANQLALRALAGERRRVIVPETSHIYNDTGDASQTLSGLTLLPLAPGKATFTCAEVEEVLARTASGRVATDVGAIAVESPVRRLRGELFDWAEMQRLSALARERGIGLHLDGARLFIASAYTGTSPAQYAALFDTVYVSLWKCFNSGIGAILAGPRSLLDDMFHVRRMFGGNLAAGWPAAVIATHYMDGYLDRLGAAVRVSGGLLCGHRQRPLVLRGAHTGRNQPRPSDGEDGRPRPVRGSARGARCSDSSGRHGSVHPRRERDLGPQLGRRAGARIPTVGGLIATSSIPNAVRARDRRAPLRGPEATPRRRRLRPGTSR